MWSLALVVGVGLAGTLAALYYRWKARRTQEALDVVKDVRAEWEARYQEMVHLLADAEAALRARQEVERQNDLAEAGAAGTDPARAAELLNRP